MDNVEKLLKNASSKDFNIPPKVEHRVNYTLNHKHKNKWKIYAKKLSTAIASIVIVLLGGISVYAAMGGTISGKPFSEFFNIKFPDEYENYKVNVEGKEIEKGETKIDLVSTVCDEGYTILEFNVKLSKEDREYLRLDENVVTEQDIKEAEQTGGSSFLQKSKDLKNTLEILFNTKVTLDNGNEVEDDANRYVIIDGKTYYPLHKQIVNKISDYEYKIFQLYFLTDKELQDKTEFTITLNNIKLGNIADYSNSESEEKMYLVNTHGNVRKIDIEGEFNINLSKKEASQNTKIIPVNDQKINYKNMVAEIEEIKITPLQIILKLKTTRNNLSLSELTNTRNKNYIGAINYKAYNENNEKLAMSYIETKRTITYQNGKVEEWARGDIGTYKDFYNAKMETIEYLIIEKKENISDILIKLIETQADFENGGEKDVELDNFKINIKE